MNCRRSVGSGSLIIVLLMLVYPGLTARAAEPGTQTIRLLFAEPQRAAEIFAKYITENLPLHRDDLAEYGGSVPDTIHAMIRRTVEKMYSTEKSNEYLEVTYAKEVNGEPEVKSSKGPDKTDISELLTQEGVALSRTAAGQL